MKSRHFLTTSFLLVAAVFLRNAGAQELQLPSDYGFDVQLGLSAKARMMGTSAEIIGTPANAVGTEVFQTLIASSGYIQPYPWKLTLVNSPTVNASSTAGGQLFVYGGLLPIIGQNKGLWAAVLSHETAHTGERHIIKLVVRQEYNERMVQYYRARMQAGDKSAGYALAAFQISSAVLIKKMQRDQEHEADQRGMLMMARAGYHPDFVFALHHLLLSNTGEQSKFAAFFSDHPRWETRDQRSDRVYAEAVAEFDRRWPNAAASPGGQPPIVAFVGKPESFEDKNAGVTDLKIPLYCRNADAPVNVLVLLEKDNRPVKALDPEFADRNGNFAFHQQEICLDKDDAPPLSLQIPATAVPRDDHSVKAEVFVGSNGQMLTSTKFFDVHFPNPRQQSIVVRTDPKQVSVESGPVASIPPASNLAMQTVATSAANPAPDPKLVTPAAVNRGPENATLASKAPVPSGVEEVKALTVSPLKNETAPVSVAAVAAPVPSKPGVLGVSGATWTERGADGIEILEVEPDSPAEIAGLHIHDVITDVDGRQVHSNSDLAEVLAQHGPGSKIVLGYMFKSNLGWMPKETLIILAAQ